MLPLSPIVKSIYSRAVEEGFIFADNALGHVQDKIDIA
jgi:hypothetical protein